ncbi:hypothetical protein [Stenotrophomonas sp. MMGLT7]|uniref:hypothetical protein n=1 Tax=Stenotrophomonas sp. MMGLT7 TaxID=2901227 RepID=UPI001E57DD2C|nr:hypothetical protein [Stenotrophomonas sp. MMGLT7]MCD7097746.1 hypothetical protein [Stenotrophomonas sp. MMGLT7]
MNLSLHFGLLGTLEAGLIALAIGFLVYLLWSRLASWLGWSSGVTLGWACVIAVAIGAGVDAWNLFYTSIVRLESPLYARIALQSIHDPDQLGARVVVEAVAAVAGVALSFWVFSSRMASAASEDGA